MVCYSITERSNTNMVNTVEGKRDVEYTNVNFPEINKFIHLAEMEYWRNKAQRDIAVEMGTGNELLDKSITISEIKSIPLLRGDNPIYRDSLSYAKRLLLPTCATNTYIIDRNFSKSVGADSNRKKLF